MSYYELRSGGLGDTGLGDAASTEAMISGLDIELEVVRGEIQKKLNAGQNNTPEFNSLTNRLTDVMNRRASLAQQLAAEKAAQPSTNTRTNVGVGMTMTSGPGVTQLAPNAANVNALLPFFTGQQQRQPAAASGGLSTGAMIGIGAGALTLLTVVMLLARRGG